MAYDPLFYVSVALVEGPGCSVARTMVNAPSLRLIRVLTGLINHEGLEEHEARAILRALRVLRGSHKRVKRDDSIAAGAGDRHERAASHGLTTDLVIKDIIERVPIP